MATILRSKAPWTGLGVLLTAVLLSSCTDGIPGVTVHPFDPENPSEAFCSIDESEIFLGAFGGRDAIPALSDPHFVRPDNPRTDFLKDDDRVIGFRYGADILAIPVKILWYHEILNVDASGRAFAVTHCPLTGSSLVFDRGPVDGSEFGVSGLLYRNNLIMYDRTDRLSLWPQMTFGARCGPRLGTELTAHAVVETTWAAWREMQPQTFVMTDETGFERNYDVDPYGDYAESDDVLFPTDLDFRRPPKERVLGIPDGAEGVAYPFGELESLGPVAVVPHSGPTSADGSPVVFWDSSARAAMVYSNVVEGMELTFTVVDDQIVDEETGSVWRVDGAAKSGPLAGASLEPVAEAYVAFWFAWFAFNPDTALWEVS